MKDEALRIALEALQAALEALRGSAGPDEIGNAKEQARAAITAIKQARALDKMAENARELGLDYEPADGTQVSKVWWDGDKLMAKPIPLEDIYLPAPNCTRSHPHENMDAMCELRTEIARLTNENARLKAQPAPVQEPVAWVREHELPLAPGDAFSWVETFVHKTPLYTTPTAAPVQDPVHQWRQKHSPYWYDGYPDNDDGGGPYETRTLYTTPPAAQRQWVGLTNEDIYDCDEANACRSALAYAIEAKIKEKNNG